MTCVILQNPPAGKMVRLWLDELPTAACLPVGLQVETLSLQGQTVAVGSRLLAMEVFSPGGSSFQYGLLGVSFVSGPAGRFEARVPVEDPADVREMKDPLTKALDRVTIGGGAQFGYSILKSFREMDQDSLPAGIFSCTCMAQGELGSVPMMFASLARALVRMLTQPRIVPSYQQAVHLLTA